MLSASTIYGIITAPCEHIHVGDVVLAWDDDKISSFRSGIFKGYDHTICQGQCPFLVKSNGTTFGYTHIKRVPDSLVSNCNIEPESDQLEIPLNYEEGSNG